MNSGLFWFLPPLIVAIGIFGLSTFLAIPIQIEGIGGIDKWEHTFAYLVLSSTLLYSLYKTNYYTPKRAIFVLISTASYGMLLELVQYYFFSYRYFEWLDALANVLGAFIGFLLFRMLIKFL